MAALLLFSLWPRAGQNLGLTPASGSRQALARSPAGSAVTQVLAWAWAAASCRVPWCRLQRRICSPCQEEGQQQCHPSGEPRVAPRGAGAVCRHRASGEDPVPSLDPPRQPRLLATGVPSPRAPSANQRGIRGGTRAPHMLPAHTSSLLCGDWISRGTFTLLVLSEFLLQEWLHVLCN